MRTLPILAAALVLAGCGDMPSVPRLTAEDAEPAMSQSGLSVSISGPWSVDSPQTAYWSASVSGGSGTYHYTWNVYSCNEYPVGQEWCESEYVHDSGTGVNSINRWRGMYDLRIEIRLNVYDVNDSSRTGVQYWSTWGPNSISCSEWWC